MASIERLISGEGGAAKSGNTVQLPMVAAAGGEPASSPYLQWVETTETSTGLGPRIVDQVFRLVWPLIAGTEYYYTTQSAWISVNECSVDFENVTTFENIPPEWASVQSPVMVINDGAGERTVPFDRWTQSWVRIQQTDTSTTVSVGPDGESWSEVARSSRPLPVWAALDRLMIGMHWGTVDGLDPPDPAVGALADWSPALPDFGTTVYQVTDPPPPLSDQTQQTPRALRTIAPYEFSSAADKRCTTLLDLIREFSATVRCPVRIINGSTIEMVDPNEPLPDGWNAGLGRSYYTSTTQTVRASTASLTLANGYMDLTVSADVLADDVGIITGGFSIPARLPVPDLDPAPVSRVAYTFTPTGFRASVEMTFPETPLVVRKR